MCVVEEAEWTKVGGSAHFLYSCANVESLSVESN